MAKILSQLIDAQAEILSSEPTNRVARFYWDTTLQALRVSNGVAFVTIAQAQAGSGNDLPWFSDSGGPGEDELSGNKEFVYEAGITQPLSVFWKVPQNYNAGSQIQLIIGVYSPSTSGTIQMDLVSTLIRKNNDAITSTTLQHTKNATTLTNTTADQFRSTTVDVSDSSGKIAATAVSAGDLIKLQLQRGTDTDTADVRFVPSFSEITL